MTDEQLIRRAARGDTSAFEALYERHWLAVYRYAWILTRSAPDAEDITQDCFLALIRKPKAFDAACGQLRTWLIAVARRQYLGRLRRPAISVENDERSVDAVIEADLMRMERAEALREALRLLPSAQREALYLFQFEGLAIADVAGILGIETNAVKARLYRAREQLKALLIPRGVTAKERP